MKLSSFLILFQLFFLPLAEPRRLQKAARDLIEDTDNLETQVATPLEEDCGKGKGDEYGERHRNRDRRRLSTSKSSKACSSPSTAPSTAPSAAPIKTSNDMPSWRGGGSRKKRHT